jgi:hypothetical protein
VLRRRWLPLDFDPVRPSGIPSTDSEHTAALERAQECRDWLAEQGWPEPVAADSGNGAHLLYAIDLPNDESAWTLVDRCLKAVAARFSDDAVTVDTTVGNAARIWKLYGTVAAKGDGTDERPHRQARLLSTPEQMVVVTVAQLEALGALVPEPDPPQASVNGQAGAPYLNVPKWLNARGVSFRVKDRKTTDGRTVYLITCPFDPSHDHGDCSVMQAADGKLSAKCFHQSCAGKRWRDFKEALGPPDSGHYDPPLLPEGGNTVIKIISVAPPELEEDAYHGLAGQFVRAVSPYTEATEAGILFHFLPAVGMLVGPHVHVFAGGKQPARLFVVLVGPTNAGRKGTSYSPVGRLMELVDETFWKAQCVNGLSSGEGLIAYLEDKEGKDENGKLVPVEAEKRLYVKEEEFSRVLANMSREGNVLSQVLRSAFDDGNLATLTVNPRHAPGAHVSVIGHITPEELTAQLTDIQMANGWGNRFLWVVVKSDKILPDTKPIPEEVFQPFVRQLQALPRFGACQGKLSKKDRAIPLSDRAQELWCSVYPDLRLDRPGLDGAMISRRAPIVLRLALIYALLDCPLKKVLKGTLEVPDLDKFQVEEIHLKAALAVWKYAEESAQMLFHSHTGDKLADKLLRLLANGPMTRNEFNRHLSYKDKTNLGSALELLERMSIARKTKLPQEGAGRPTERWELA